MSSPHQSVPPVESSHTAPEGSDTGSSTTTIRVPRLALLGVVVLLLGVFFFVVGSPAYLWWVLALPIAVAVWVLRTRTRVSESGLDLRGVFGSRHVDWSSVQGLRIPKRGFVRLHLDDDSEVRLPAVGYERLRDLIDASNGRIPDPFAAAEADRPDTEDDTDDRGAAPEKKPDDADPTV